MMTKLTLVCAFTFAMHSIFSQTFTDLQCSDLKGLMWSSVDLADMDKDGDLDILSCGTDADLNPFTIIYQNNGNDCFKEIEQTFTGVWGGWSGFAKWGDYNGDGFPDFAITGKDASGKRILEIHKNNGDTTFTKLNTTFGGTYSGELNWIDFNNDQKLETECSRRCSIHCVPTGNHNAKPDDRTPENY